MCIPMKKMQIWIVFSIILCTKIVNSSRKLHKRNFKDYLSIRKNASSVQNTITNEAIAYLSKVFDIDRVPVGHHYRSPPQYMIELYKSVADIDGLTVSQSPYGSDVVRGLPDRDSDQKLHFYFNISYIHPHENILEAELHLFRLRPKVYPKNSAMIKKSHIIDVYLYELLKPTAIPSDDDLKLIEVRKVSLLKNGWILFKVKSTVQRWIASGNSNNHGFIIKAKMKDGSRVSEFELRFAQRSEHHDSKQPVLVVFSEKNKRITQSAESMHQKPNGYQNEERFQNRAPEFLSKHQVIKYLNEETRAQYRKNYSIDKEENDFNMKNNSSNGSEIKVRTKRSKKAVKESYNKNSGYPGYVYRKKKGKCSRQSLYVDFEEIGWAGWIISPKGYNAYQCKGECPFPLGQNQKPTNHATVQSIVHALRKAKSVGTPCCVPNKLYSISLLYFDDDENVILQQYDDMVAVSCGCH